MKSKREIETVIRNLEIPTSQGADEWILSDAINALAAAKRRKAGTGSSQLWRTIMKNPWTILTTAAAALFAVVTGIHYLNSANNETMHLGNLTESLDNQPTINLTSTPPPDPSGSLAPLPIELPHPKFVGTEQDIRVPYLNRDHTKDRPPFLAPRGTINVALHKAVTSSDPVPIIGELELVTDGDKEAMDGCWVELGPGVQWIQVDLGARYNLYAVLFWHWHKQACVVFDVVVQVSDDPDFIMNVTTLFNNDRDNSSGLGIGEDMHYIETHQGKLIDAKGVKARYVRLYSNGRTVEVDQNFYTEVEVYGKSME